MWGTACLPLPREQVVPLQQAEVVNRLLARLSAEDFSALASQLEPTKLPRAMVLAGPDEPMAHAYFLEEGAASIVATSREGQRAEAGLIGREGFVHPALALGADRTPQLIQMQMTGAGYRIARGAFVDAFTRSPTLRSTLLLFAQVLLVQSSLTSLANAVHPVHERLARWLLMCHDRSAGDDLPLTQGFMSTMLSIRRPSVTTAIHVLAGNGFIAADRGVITIRDRAALEAFAGDAYGQPEAEYRRLLGPL